MSSVDASAEPWFVAETLAWCNSIRVLDDREPLKRLPQGYRDSPESCPCGRAAGVWVFQSTYRPLGDKGEKREPLPAAVIEFVAAFDRGALPQYDLSPGDS